MPNIAYNGGSARPEILLFCVMAFSTLQSGQSLAVPSWENTLNNTIVTQNQVLDFVYSPCSEDKQARARKANLLKLNEIASLKENWNSYGASPFSPKLLETARRIIIGLSIQPEVFPTADDSIQIEYDGPQGSYLEIQITENSKFEVLQIDKDGHESVMHVVADISALDQVVRKFYGSTLS